MSQQPPEQPPTPQPGPENLPPHRAGWNGQGPEYLQAPNDDSVLQAVGGRIGSGILLSILLSFVLFLIGIGIKAFGDLSFFSLLFGSFFLPLLQVVPAIVLVSIRRTRRIGLGMFIAIAASEIILYGVCVVSLSANA
jgi:hypothetical protein